MSNKCTYWCVAAGMLFLVSACDVIIPNRIEVSEQEALQKYAHVPMQKILTDVQNKVEQAKRDEIYFFSPNNYHTALIGLQSARARVRDPEKKSFVLTTLYRVDKSIDDGYVVKKIVQRELQDVVDLRNTLDYLKAKKSHSREYIIQMNNLNLLIERIEKSKEDLFKTESDRKDFADQKKEIMGSLDEFRSRVVRFNYLNQGDTLVAEAEAHDAKTRAPKTYAEVIRQRELAVDYINKNINNLQGIFAVGEKYYFAAKHLKLVTREINAMTAREVNAQEEYVLRIENLLGKIADALKVGNIRNQTFSIQVDKLSSAAVRLAQAAGENAPGNSESNQQKKTRSSQVMASSKQQAASHVKQPIKAESGAQFPTIRGVPSSSQDPEDLDAMRKNVILLTDQIYQLTVEKNEWTSERLQLLDKIKNLEAQLKKPQ